MTAARCKPAAGRCNSAMTAVSVPKRRMLSVSGMGQAGAMPCNCCYRIRLAEDAGGHELDVTDWMYLMENGTIMNRSQFRKFGIKVAELVATMRPACVS